MNRLKACLVQPKHMMDSSSHYKAKERIGEEQSSAFEMARKRKQDEEQQAEGIGFFCHKL